MLFSEEQKSFFNTESLITYILAFAGTGKTTTLIEFAKRKINSKILYVAFNESVIKEAKNKFPLNTEVMTSHSLAYKILGYKYFQKLYFNIPIDKVMSALFLSNTKYNKQLAMNIINGINKFCQSEFLNIEDAYYLAKESKNFNYSETKFKFYLKIIWEKMSNVNSKFPITHDFYLKKLQLESVDLGYDFILCDEAQDVNSSTKRIILDQLQFNTKLIFVGDLYQNIYSFRGSENVFLSILDEKNSNSYYLTKSFRFGNSIADVANSIISFLGETKKIKGNKEIKSKINEIDFEKQYTVITRTNAMLIGNALKAADYNKKIFFIDNKKNIDFQKIIDIDHLRKGENSKILNHEIKKFGNLKELERIVELQDNQEYKFLINIIKTNKGNLTQSIKKIIKLTTTNISEADVVLTTAHKSKGLEFNQVILSNDFYFPFDKNNNLKQNVNREELNILYVAATRAIYNLKLNKTIEKMIEYDNRK